MGLLEGRVAIITGAGGALGSAGAKLFAQEGATVLVNDVNVEAAERVVKEIKAAGGTASVDTNSIDSAPGCEAILAHCLEALGEPDILINNAVVLRDRMLHNMTDEEWDTLMRVGLSAVFWLTRATVRRWRDQVKAEIAELGRPAKRRKIINLTSVAGLRGNPGQTNYSAAKMGVVGMTKTWAKELGRLGICVNAVAPGAWTPVTEALPLGQLVKAGGDMKYQFLALGDLAMPEDVAYTWLFLASDHSNFITGQVINVDGGGNI